MSDVIPVIPVGPGEYEKARAARVLDSLVRHEADMPRVVLVIDGVTEADLCPHLRPGAFKLAFVRNPRNGSGSGIYDGLACGLTAAYKFIADHHPGAHAWKIDTDALVLRPTSRQIDAFFAANPKHGLAGTYATNPGRKSREAEFVPGREVAKRFLRPLWYWRSHRRFTSPFFGRNRRFAKWMRQANAAGLPWGWHVQGGSYGVSGRFLATLNAVGWLDDPEIWLGAPMSEDVGFTHWAFIHGYTVGEFNGPGEAFGVKGVGLPMPIDELIAADYGVVHSLKTGDWASECGLADELVRRTDKVGPAATLVPSPGTPGVG